MANLLNRIFRRNEQQLVAASAIPFGTGGFYHRGHAEVYAWQVVGKIYAGVNNIAFTSSDPRLSEVADFLNANAASLIYLMHHHGWAGVTRKDGRLVVIDPARARLDEEGRPVDTRWVVYSQCYRLTRRTDMATIRPSLDMIEKYKGADDFLVSVYGTIGILSSAGTDLPLRPDERDKFVEKMKHRWGIGAERQQIEVFSSAVNFQQLDFHAERLELPEKVRDEVKAIAGYFNVPYDLLPISGQSTYANQEQAVRTFYSSCVAPLAELLLTLGRDIARDETFLSTKVLSWHFENIPEMQTDRTAELAHQRALVDFYRELKDAGEELESVRNDILEQIKMMKT